MAFTAGELANIANAALDFYFNRGEAFQQALQSRPLVKTFDGSTAKTFPGGKGNISLAVQGVYGNGGVNDSLKGYTHTDTVTFYNPANIQRVNFPWREMHIGIELTYTELKIDGISVTSEFGASGISEHSGRDATVLVNLWQNKLFDFGERYARSLNTLLWGDGAADAKALAGIRSIITDDPTVGTVGGLDRSIAANGYWRNRAYTAAMGVAVTATPALAAWGGAPVASNPANGGALWQVLQSEMRQLRRYGGQPNTFLAGSGFIGKLEIEMRANGYYSDSGFKKSLDGAMGPVLFDGTTIQYDPTLDDLGLTNRAYWFDNRHIYLMKMQNEWRKVHNPARPIDQFILARSITSTGQLVAQQANSALVIDVVP